MVGATQGLERLTVALIVESQETVAGKPAATTFTVSTWSPSSGQQLTASRNSDSSFLPRRSGGTSGSSLNTSPRTRIVRWPSESSLPFASRTSQGSSSPGIPRIGNASPTNGPSTPYIVSNDCRTLPACPPRISGIGACGLDAAKATTERIDMAESRGVRIARLLRGRAMSRFGGEVRPLVAVPAPRFSAARIGSSLGPAFGRRPQTGRTYPLGGNGLNFEPAGVPG